MAKTDTLSPSMQAALALVPADWERMPHRLTLGERSVRSVLFDKTFCALRDRNLIEVKGRPGDWRWRLVDPTRDPELEAARETREAIIRLEEERSDLSGRVAAALRRIDDIDAEIAALSGARPASAAA